MAIVFAASVPHSPLLLETIGGASTQALAKTEDSLRQLTSALKESSPEALVIISPHARATDHTATLNIRPTFTLAFDEFGEFRTRTTIPGSLVLANAIKEPFDTQRHQFPLTVVSDELLDYGCTTPLSLLYRELSGLPLVPIGDGLPTLAASRAFGQQLHALLVEHPLRIAVIASANLSHRLSTDTPAGFSPRAKAFDARTRHAIQTADVERLVRTRAETIQEVAVCGLGPLLMLFGCLAGMQYHVNELSYEAPFGIGLPVYQFRFSL